jgi:hypothetical protein
MGAGKPMGISEISGDELAPSLLEVRSYLG